ncbi:hypothetical protein ACSMXN_14410 [Jatrophihabitans sp. DSM 45814]
MTTVSERPDHKSPAAEYANDLSPEARNYYADLVEQLFREYEPVLSLCGIVELVNQCRRDLAGSPATAMPELLERLARCRLSVLAEQQRP